MTRVVPALGLAVWLCGLPAWAQLYRNGPAPRERPQALQPMPVQEEAPPVASEPTAPVEVGAGRSGSPVYDGGRLSLSLMASNAFGAGTRIEFNYPIARRLFGGNNALSLGTGLSFFPNAAYESSGCYPSYPGACSSDGMAVGLSAGMGWRFGVGDHVELGPRTALVLWVAGDSALTLLAGFGASVRPWREGSFRIFFDLDFGHADRLGGGLVLFGLGIGWQVGGLPDAPRAAPTQRPALSLGANTGTAPAPAPTEGPAVHTGWRWTLSGQWADDLYGLGARTGLSLPLSNNVLSNSSAITLGFEVGYFEKSETWTASALLGWRFGLGDHFEIGPRLGVGFWGLGRRETLIVTAGTSLGIRPSVHSGFRIVIDADFSRWHGRRDVLAFAAGLGYAF